MKKNLLIICALMLVAVFSGSLFAKETVRIGLIVPLTGDVKTFGESYKNAFFLALDDYAKKGKYTIDPVIADDKNDPTEGTNAALKLMTQDKATAVIGPMTSKVTIPVGELATKQKVPLVTGTATNPKVTISDGKRKSYVFRACFIDPFQGTVAAGFALKNLKAGTAAILYDVGNDYSKGLADYFQATFKKGKGTIVAYESYQKDDVDFSALITKIQVKKPDVIYIPDYYNKVALIAKQIREKGLRSTMLGGDGWDSPDLIRNAGDAVVGSYFTNHYSPDRKDPVAEVFIKRYKQKYNAVPDTFAALGYDATMILLKALDSAKRPAQDDIVKQLAVLKNFKGVTGNIGFDKNGDAVKSVVILKVEKEGFKYVTTINP